jgi:BirA family biotin operon repressor/biotin-[acetyl-CoA-carboxylase] ligase
MDENALRRALLHSPVNELRAFELIGSTNDEALRWIDAGVTDFALVIADQQTNGRGRLNRQWITRPEASLAFSVIFKPTPQELAAPSSLYAPLCGLAVWQALHEVLGLDPQIKWPNDILIERQKCCGILVEAAWSGAQLNGIVLGIGINITADSLPPDAVTRYPATWVKKFTPQPVDRFALLAEILGRLQYWRDRLGSNEFFTTWQNHLAFRGETVRIVENQKTSIIGTEESIDSSGNLILRDADGKNIIIEVGDVTLRPEDEK